MSLKPWKQISKTHQHKATLFNYYHVESESLESGKKGKFDVVETVNWVNIIAVTKDQNVVLVKQFRQGTDCFTLEIPGGGIEHGEDPLFGAKRELLEETGFETENWEELGNNFVNPAFMTNTCYFYLAKDCEKSSDQNLDHLEEIEIIEKPLSKMPELLLSNEINHSLVSSAFNYFQLKGHRFT